jgi:predicted NBD/HSP70 family sugar kinase
MQKVDESPVRPLGARSNSLAVFNEVLFDGPVLRSDIAQRTNLTAASVSRITRQLIDAGVIEEFEQHKTGKPGRSHVSLRLKQDAGYVVGISLNGFEQRIAIASLQNEVIAEEPLPREPTLDPAQSSRVIVQQVQALLRKSRVPRSRVLAVGVANAGMVDSKRGIVIHAPTLGWDNVPLGSQIQKGLGIPVRMNSLVNALAAAEYRFGDATKFRDFIVVHATLGIGMGIVVDGQPVQGHQHHAGLIGRMPVALKNKERTETVLNDVAGAAAIYAKWAGLPPLNLLEVTEPLVDKLIEAANSGDRKAIDACELGAAHLGQVVATIGMALDSEAIMLVGPLVKIDAYRNKVEAVVREVLQRPIEITVSKKRGIEAAYMLGVSEVAADDMYLRKLLV